MGVKMDNPYMVAIIFIVIWLIIVVYLFVN